MPVFDGYVAVDWSANAQPKRGRNSIWIAVCDTDGPPQCENPRTREAAMERIQTLLDEATAKCRRLLCGFDFPFGYPEHTAQKLTGYGGWEAVWERIAEVIQDCPNNGNNSFAAAARLNQAFDSEGPFWGHGQNPVPGIPGSRPEDVWGMNLLPRLRYSECLIPQAKEVWRLFGQGTVGRQALTGIARLQRLRCGRDDVQVWPFETLGEGRSHVLAEIYPSLIVHCPNHATKDEGQVEAVAVTLRELDRSGDLQEYLQAPNAMPARVIAEEGLILGMQDPVGFRAVAAQVTPSCDID